LLRNSFKKKTKVLKKRKICRSQTQILRFIRTVEITLPEDIERCSVWDMKMKELSLDERPREKMLEKGADALSNAELLAILLRTGTGGMNVVETARELLAGCGNRINEVAGMSTERLCQVKGIGPGKAVSIAAAFELGRRCAAEAAREQHTSISSPKDAVRLLLPHLRDLDHEECWVLFLNRANYLINKERITIGSGDATLIDIRTIIRRAIEKKATGIILSHNHPSGNAMPGKADIEETARLKKALGTCDISLIDHIVIASKSYYSFSDEELCRF
jgi:DNA repair protein RadC